MWPLVDGTFLSFIEVTGGVTGHATCRDGTISDGFNLHSARGISQQNLIREPSPWLHLRGKCKRPPSRGGAEQGFQKSFFFCVLIVEKCGPFDVCCRFKRTQTVSEPFTLGLLNCPCSVPPKRSITPPQDHCAVWRVRPRKGLACEKRRERKTEGEKVAFSGIC